MERRDSRGLVANSARSDVVADSVATYSDNPDVFADFSATAVAGPFARFSSLLAPGAIVLDAGCGPGRDLARLAGLGHQGNWVDLNDHFARRALIHAPIVLGDLRRLPLASDSFDAVWACASLIHLPADDVGHHDPGFTLRTYTHLMPDSTTRTQRVPACSATGETLTTQRRSRMTMRSLTSSNGCSGLQVSSYALHSGVAAGT